MTILSTKIWTNEMIRYPGVDTFEIMEIMGDNRIGENKVYVNVGKCVALGVTLIARKSIAKISDQTNVPEITGGSDMLTVCKRIEVLNNFWQIAVECKILPPLLYISKLSGGGPNWDSLLKWSIANSDGTAKPINLSQCSNHVLIVTYVLLAILMLSKMLTKSIHSSTVVLYDLKIKRGVVFAEQVVFLDPCKIYKFNRWTTPYRRLAKAVVGKLRFRLLT
ncbi:hypothetical protein Tco_1422107, partial [Tanacetum coccineum]